MRFQKCPDSFGHGLIEGCFWHGEWRTGKLFLVVPQAHHCNEFRMPKCPMSNDHLF